MPGRHLKYQQTGRAEDQVWSAVKDKLGMARKAQEGKEETRHAK